MFASVAIYSYVDVDATSIYVYPCVPYVMYYSFIL
jgi:hypothetical protein